MTALLAFFRKKENWPIIIIPILLLLWAQFGAINLGLISFNSVFYFNSPYNESLPEGEGGERVAQHVVLIVVDALRDDTSRTLPTLGQLRSEGAGRVLVAGELSFSLPGWAVIGTGAWQEQNGFVSNYPENAIAIDTIFRAAHNAGLTTAIVGATDWGQLYPEGVDTLDLLKYSGSEADVQAVLAYDAELAARGVKMLKQQPDFTLLYLTAVDSLSHAYGAISPQAAEAARADDQHIADFLAEIDLSNTAVLVVSDHGQVDRGGHGGGEPVVLRTPLIAVGQGIKAGVYPDATQTDLAPTLAVLLGAPFPANNEGDALFDMIATPAALKATRAVDNATQVIASYEAMLKVIGDTGGIDPKPLEDARTALGAGNDAEALRLALQANADARARWNEGRTARLTRERLLRLPLVLLMLLPLALYSWWWKRAGWNWQAPLAGGILYLVLWNVVYFLVRGLTYSVSWFNQDADIEAFITGRVIDTMIILLVIMVVVGVWRRRTGALGVARDAVNTLLVVAAVLLIQILFFYVMWNVAFDWTLPDMLLAFKYYMDVFQTTVFWPMTPLPLAALLPLVALLVAWISNRVAGLFARQPAIR